MSSEFALLFFGICWRPLYFSFFAMLLFPVASHADMGIVGERALAFEGKLEAPLVRMYWEPDYLACTCGCEHRVTDPYTGDVYDAKKVLGKDPVLIVFVDPASAVGKEFLGSLLFDLFCTRWWWNSVPRLIFVTSREVEKPVAMGTGAYFPVIADMDGRIRKLYGIEKLPSLVFVGRDRKVRLSTSFPLLGADSVTRLFRSEYADDNKVDWDKRKFMNAYELEQYSHEASLIRFSCVGCEYPVASFYLWSNCIVVNSSWDTTIAAIMAEYNETAASGNETAFMEALPAKLAKVLDGLFLKYITSVLEIDRYEKKPLPSEDEEKVASFSTSEEGQSRHVRTIYFPKTGEVARLEFVFEDSGRLLTIDKTPLGKTSPSLYDTAITFEFDGVRAYDANRIDENYMHLSISGAELFLSEIRSQSGSMNIDPPMKIATSDQDGRFYGDPVWYNYSREQGDFVTLVFVAEHADFQPKTVEIRLNMRRFLEGWHCNNVFSDRNDCDEGARDGPHLYDIDMEPLVKPVDPGDDSNEMK